jgi:hypothetical protein
MADIDERFEAVINPPQADAESFSKFTLGKVRLFPQEM